MQVILLVFFVIVLTGCISSSQHSEADIRKNMLRQTIRLTQCPHNKIRIPCMKNGNKGCTQALETRGQWLAIACGRYYMCGASMAEIEMHVAVHRTPATNDVMVCEETPESKERTRRAIVIDQVSLETDCPPGDIKITRKSKWRRGTEQAYRLEACGSTHVCTIAAGRASCKKLLNEGSPAVN